MKELEQLTEVVMSMHASIVDLQGKVLAQGAALEALCRTLPPQWQPQAARNLQESAEHLLELMDDEPTPQN
ncbi:hypothetical protein [Bordetella trematum]|uniref:hypothetical protein n=1 Tax=Bordetella trematum TaxID=123899 RepID=UPI003AF37C52